jgi:hypothetical protein
VVPREERRTHGLGGQHVRLDVSLPDGLPRIEDRGKHPDDADEGNGNEGSLLPRRKARLAEPNTGCVDDGPEIDDRPGAERGHQDRGDQRGGLRQVQQEDHERHQEVSRLQAIDRLARRDQQALYRTIDAFLKSAGGG